VTESVTVVLPALDEAASVGRVVGDLLGLADEIVVVDNGSSDGTGAIAAAAGARVVVEPRRGFGSACFAGTVAARGDIVCFLDADGTFAPADVARVVREVSEHKLDLCLGSRTLLPGAIRLDHRIVNRALGLSLIVAGGPRLTDIGPLRAIRREALLALGVEDRAFAWPLEMVIRAVRAKLVIGEIPVAYLPRFGGESKVTGSLRGSLRVARQMSVLLAREALR
jgi:glycosyltransferase involved in cell wall biosynthesis